MLFSTLLLLLLSLTGETAMPPRKRPGAAGSNGGPRAKKGKTAGASMKVLGKGLRPNVSECSDSDPELSETDEEVAELPTTMSKNGTLADNLAFFSSNLDSAQLLYDDYVQLVQPGKTLLTRHYDEDGFLVTDALFAVINSLPHRDGLLVEATFCGSLDKAPADLQNITAGSDHLLFLQRFALTSSLVAVRPGLQPVHEWKPGFLDSLDESWMSSGLRSKVRDAFRSANVKKLVEDKKETAASTRRPSALKNLLLKQKTVPAGKHAVLIDPADSFPPLPPPARPPDDEADKEVTGMPGSKALERLRKTLVGEVDSAEATAGEEHAAAKSKEAIIDSLKAKLAAVRKQKDVTAAGKSKGQTSKSNSKKPELSLLQRLTRDASSGKGSSGGNLTGISSAISDACPTTT